MKTKLEYIWLDGFSPTQNPRSKTRVETNFSGKLEDCPMWSFDGSSTQQADGGASDCLLKPVALFEDPGRPNAFLVMTEVMNADGTPHESNGRATIEDDDDDFWFGFEQEYFLWDTRTNLPPGFPIGGYPGPQGAYYCLGGRAQRLWPRLRGRASRRLLASRHQRRRHQRRSGRRPVGVPGVCQGCRARWRRNLGGPLSGRAHRREVRAFHQLAPEARARRLERLRHARQLLQRRDARSRRRGQLPPHLRTLRQEHRPPHRRVRRGQRPAPDGACTKRNPSTSSTTASRTAALPSASPSPPSRRAGGDVWKTGARPPTPIPTRWRPLSSRRPRKRWRRGATERVPPPFRPRFVRLASRSDGQERRDDG